MEKSVCYVHSLDEVDKLELIIRRDFLADYEHFSEKFEQYGISLVLQPCYYYNGKFHTKRNNKHCYLMYRIVLLPKGCTLSQAQQKFSYKKFFSKKLATISKDVCGYRVKINGIKDWFFLYYINKYLAKAKAFSIRNLSCMRVLNENLVDVLWSIVFIYRYRNEVKHTIRGKSLEWVFLLFVFLLICLSSYFRIKFLEQFR